MCSGINCHAASLLQGAVLFPWLQLRVTHVRCMSGCTCKSHPHTSSRFYAVVLQRPGHAALPPPAPPDGRPSACAGHIIPQGTSGVAR